MATKRFNYTEDEIKDTVESTRWDTTVVGFTRINIVPEGMVILMVD